VAAANQAHQGLGAVLRTDSQPPDAHGTGPSAGAEGGAWASWMMWVMGVLLGQGGGGAGEEDEASLGGRDMGVEETKGPAPGDHDDQASRAPHQAGAGMAGANADLEGEGADDAEDRLLDQYLRTPDEVNRITKVWVRISQGGMPAELTGGTVRIRGMWLMKRMMFMTVVRVRGRCGCGSWGCTSRTWTLRRSADDSSSSNRSGAATHTLMLGAFSLLCHHYSPTPGRERPFLIPGCAWVVAVIRRAGASGSTRRRGTRAATRGGRARAATRTSANDWSVTHITHLSEPVWWGRSLIVSFLLACVSGPGGAGGAAGHDHRTGRTTGGRAPRVLLMLSPQP
jgi:hypothetical protein